MSSDLRAKAKAMGIPDFSPEFLQESSKQQYDSLQGVERETFIDKWYEFQIPHYETFFLQNKLKETEQKAFGVGVPQFTTEFLSQERMSEFNNCNDNQKIELVIKWYEFQIPHYQNQTQPQAHQRGSEEEEMSSHSLSIKEDAKKLGVPDFNISFLKEETKAKYLGMSRDEQIALEIKWYEAQIPHYRQQIQMQGHTQHNQSEASNPFQKSKTEMTKF